jgi:hypothetical protein
MKRRLGQGRPRRICYEMLGCDRDREMGHPVIETLEEVSHDRFDNCNLMVFASKGFDGLN